MPQTSAPGKTRAPRTERLANPSRVLVATEKHATRYLNASSPEALRASALKLVHERNEIGYYSYLTQMKAPDVSSLLTEEYIKTLPNEELRRTARAQSKAIQRALAEYSDSREDVELLQRALAGDGEAAFEFLEIRSDGEYEHISLETIE